MKVIKPPHQRNISHSKPHIFLAGSIEMGSAEDWQTTLTEYLSDDTGTIFNPRRDDWDSSWTQDITNTEFRKQVEWELQYITEADIVVFYFDPNTKSPITLLELGLCAGRYNRIGAQSIIVCCPKGYWRRGNVQIVCDKYNIDLTETMEELQGAIRIKMKERE